MTAVVPLTQVNDQAEGYVALQDRALAYGDGLFETLRIGNLQPVLADLHWSRLRQGLDVLGIELPLSRVQSYFQQFLTRAAAHGLKHGVVKVLVSRGSGGRGFAPPRAAEPMVYLSWHDLPVWTAENYRHGIELLCCEQQLPRRPWLAGLKHLNCLEYVLARAELARQGYVDGLLCDDRAQVIETTSANIFLLRGKQLLTPVLDHCGIAGTLRHWILQSARLPEGVIAQSAELDMADIATADEVFVCNSVMGVMPVVRVGGYRGLRGPVTRVLQTQVGQLFKHA